MWTRFCEKNILSTAKYHWDTLVKHLLYSLFFLDHKAFFISSVELHFIINVQLSNIHKTVLYIIPH